MTDISAEDLATLVAIEVGQAEAMGEEKNNANKAKMNALMGDEAAMAAEMKLAEDTFAAADTNGDGTLNEAEWADYSAKTVANARASGWHVLDPSESDLATSFAIYKKIGGDDKGVPKATLFAIGEKVMVATMEKMG